MVSHCMQVLIGMMVEARKWVSGDMRIQNCRMVQAGMRALTDILVWTRRWVLLGMWAWLYMKVLADMMAWVDMWVYDCRKVYTQKYAQY